MTRYGHITDAPAMRRCCRQPMTYCLLPLEPPPPGHYARGTPPRHDSSADDIAASRAFRFRPTASSTQTGFLMGMPRYSMQAALRQSTPLHIVCMRHFLTSTERLLPAMPPPRRRFAPLHAPSCNIGAIVEARLISPRADFQYSILLRIFPPLYRPIGVSTQSCALFRGH